MASENAYRQLVPTLKRRCSSDNDNDEEEDSEWTEADRWLPKSMKTTAHSSVNRMRDHVGGSNGRTKASTCSGKNVNHANNQQSTVPLLS